jgi:hypothetical protein
VATTELAPDGSFTLTDVPSPGDYQMIVEKPGSPPEVRDVKLEPGAPLTDVEVVIAPANGFISGTVIDPQGQPIGGATIVASDGSTSIETVSWTSDPPGSYELRNLPTPGQYTVTVTSPGYAPEARTVTLTAEQLVSRFDAQLVPATGRISGRAMVDGAPSRGVLVTVSGGAVNRTSSVVSQGPSAGSFTFTGLEAPGTYTLTFAGEDLISQVRVVDLDPLTGMNPSTIEVSLSRERTVVGGLIRNVDGRPVSGATVTLSDGANDRTVLSADLPLGEFEFANVAPGAYTVSASLVGTEPVVVLVNVAAATPTPRLDLQLGAQASLHGNVVLVGGAPAAGLPVRLFLPAQFPNGDVLAQTQTDAAGAFTFPSLAAPADYVVAVYAGAGSADPLDSATVRTVPGAPTTVPTITVQLP